MVRYYGRFGTEHIEFLFFFEIRFGRFCPNNPPYLAALGKNTRRSIESGDANTAEGTRFVKDHSLADAVAKSGDEYHSHSSVEERYRSTKC
jgi:hypothetical protein